MAKKIELLHTTYDESGNIESQEVVHPLTSPDCIIMENGKTLDEVMGDGIATPTLTHEGTSFKVGVGDSNIEVVDGDVAGMTLKGQSYQNILPKPTTLIMETDEKEFKINDKIDSNIIIDDNIAEIATVKGKTIVNAVQEESASEYTVLGEDLSGQSITHVKETPTLEGQTLVNLALKEFKSFTASTNETANNPLNKYTLRAFAPDMVQPNKEYYLIMHSKYVSGDESANNIRIVQQKQNEDRTNTWLTERAYLPDANGWFRIRFTTVDECNYISLAMARREDSGVHTSTYIYSSGMLFEYQEGMENWNIPYFEGEKYFESNIKGVTLQGQTLVNTIQEPCKDDYVVLGADDAIEISAETGGHGTIEDTVQGGINSAVLEGMTLVNLANLFSFDDDVTTSTYFIDKTVCETSKLQVNKPYLICFKPTVKENLNTGNYVYLQLGLSNSKNMTEAHPTVEGSSHTCNINHNEWNFIKITFKDFLGYQYLTVRPLRTDSPSDDKPITYNVNEGFMLLEYQEGMENWDIPYFEGMKSVQMPVVKTTGKNLFDIDNPKNMGYDYKKTGSTITCLNTTVPVFGYENLDKNKTYTLSFDFKLGSEGSSDSLAFSFSDKKQVYNSSTSYFINLRGNYAVGEVVKIEFNISNKSSIWVQGGLDTFYSNIQIEEGSTATEYEPYQSSTVSINDYALNITQFEQGTFSESSPAGTPYRQTLPTTYIDVRLRSKSLFKISGNTIRGTLNAGYGIFFGFFKDGKYLAKYRGWIDSTSFSVDVPYECNEFCIILRKNISDTVNVSEYDLIGLTLEQVVELRGIGDVKDELDLTTGKLTQRIGEIVLDGSEDWSMVEKFKNNSEYIYCENRAYDNLVKNWGGEILSDKLPKTQLTDFNLNDCPKEEAITSTYDVGNIRLSIKADKLTTVSSQGLQDYLSQNPIKVQYELETPAIKTIDLQVTDQDGNTIPHIQTQPTVTHITASSDYLIPTVTINNNLSYDTIIKPSTLYTVRFNHDTVNTDNPLTVDLGGTVQTVTSTEFTITTPGTLIHNQLVFSGKNNVVSEVQVIEGDVVGTQYPFFEGMNDVGQTVLENCLPSLSNFYKDDHTKKVNAWFGAGSSDFNYSVDSGSLSMTMISTGSRVLRCDDLTKVKPNTKYLVKIKYTTSSSNTINFGYVDTGIVYQHLATGVLSDTWFIVTTPSSDEIIGMWFGILSNIQSGVKFTFKDVQMIEYQDGMENWNIPYFENKQKVSDVRMVVTGKNLVKHLLGSDYYGFTITAAEGSSTIINGTLTAEYCDYYIFGVEANTHLKNYVNQMEVGKTICFSSNAGNFLHYISIGKPNTPTSYYKDKYTKKSEDEVLLGMFIRFTKDCSFNNQTLQIQIEESSVPTPYEPYHEIIVQQDVDSIPLTSDMFEQGYYVQSNSIEKMSLQQIPKDNNTEIRIMNKSLVKVKPNTKYILNNDSVFMWALEFDKNGAYLGTRIGTGTDDTLKNYMNTNTYTEYVGIVLLYSVAEDNILPSDLDSMNLILQEVPQEIVLRGIGDVKDELDLTRGEYIQRIGEVIYDGSDDEIWRNEENRTTYAICKISLPQNVLGHGDIPSSHIKCDNIMTGVTYKESDGKEQISAYRHKNNNTNTDYSEIRICLPISYLPSVTVQDFRNYIKNHPFTVQYQLETPIIHKVNLTNTKVIQSYATETHYETITPSDSLIPNITIPSTLNYNVAIKPSTEYTIRANTSDNLTVDLGGTTGTLSNGKVTLTTPTTLTHNEVKFSGTGKVKELMVVEGNEIKDNVPFFNGMKNVEMGGIKLVNIARGAVVNSLVSNVNGTQYTYTSNGSTSWGDVVFDKALLKPNTVYTVYMNIVSNTSDNGIKIQLANGKDGVLNISKGTTGIIKQTIVSAQELVNSDKFALYFRNSSTSGQKVVIQNPMIIEGDWTHLDEIPFIESEMIIEQPIIRSQGKNLFDVNKLVQDTNGSHFNSGGYRFPLINFEVGKTYTISVSESKWIKIGEFSSGVTIVENFNTTKLTITITNDLLKSYIMVNNSDCSVITDVEWLRNNVQIEEGSTATSYEPYKHQTLYSNRVIGYEDGCYYAWDTGTKASSGTISSVISDVEGLNVAYVTHASSNFSFYDKDGAYLSGSMFLSTATDFDRFGFIKIPANAKYMKMACGNANSSAAKDYHLKATVTGELPLRSLPNGVCDTLNLVTGEYVQRVGEIVLDGVNIKPKWIVQGVTNNITSYFDFEKVFVGAKTGSYAFSHKFIYENYLYNDDRTRYKEGIRIGDEGWGSVRIFNSRLETADYNGFVKWLQQNPITVQYELATPIVRKLGFTTKGNYKEVELNGSEDWDRHGNYGTVTRFNLVISDIVPGRNHVFSDTLPKGEIGTNDLECINNHGSFNQFQFQIKTSRLTSDSVNGLKQWLSLNTVKVGYLSTNSASLYSNIHKPIFFNNVDVQYLPNNVDIQPELTLQARTRNSYVMDMMKADTKYTMKCLSYSDGARLWLSNGTANTSVATNKSFSFAQSSLDNANKQLVIVGQWYEPMIIEGDVTGKNLPYFKGILSSYHDVDEIEIHSVNKNLFDMSKVKPYEERGVYWWNTIVKENEVVSVRVGDVQNGQFGAYATLDVRPNSVYTLYIEMEKDGEPFGGQIYVYENDKVWGNGTFSGYANTTHHFRTSQNAQYITIGLNYGKDFPTGTTFVSKNMRLYLGEESSVYIPHAHNTTLIEMPTRLETVKVVRPVMENGAINTGNGANAEDTTNSYLRSDFIPVQPKEFIYFLNGNSDRVVNIICYNKDKNFMCYLYNSNDYVPENCYFVRIYMGKANTSDLTMTRMAYKPIQLNSLPNGVYDEIIMKPNSSKAQLVQRVGKEIICHNMKNGMSPSYRKYAFLLLDANLAKSETYDTTRLLATVPIRLVDSGGTFTQDNGTPCIVHNLTYDYGVREIAYFPHSTVTTYDEIQDYTLENPITVYYELATPIIHEIQLKGYPHVYEDGTVTLNTDVPHQTLVSYNVNQEQLINTQNETIIRHDQQIDDLYYYIEMYLEEIYQMELFRMKLELSL